jgi:hypothetical protein
MNAEISGSQHMNSHVLSCIPKFLFFIIVVNCGILEECQEM